MENLLKIKKAGFKNIVVARRGSVVCIYFIKSNLYQSCLSFSVFSLYRRLNFQNNIRIKSNFSTRIRAYREE